MKKSKTFSVVLDNGLKVRDVEGFRAFLSTNKGEYELTLTPKGKDIGEGLSNCIKHCIRLAANESGYEIEEMRQELMNQFLDNQNLRVDELTRVQGLEFCKQFVMKNQVVWELELPNYPYLIINEF